MALELFIGRQEVTLDHGRLYMPRKMVRILARRGSVDGTLTARQEEEQHQGIRYVALYEGTQAQTDAAQENALDGVYTLQLAESGRLVIPDNLRQWIEVEDKAAIIGVGSRMEIWNPDRLRYCQETSGAGYAAYLACTLTKARRSPQG